MSRPLIGISADTRGFGEETAQVVIDRYLEAVTMRADVDAVLIPARPDLVDAIAVADRLDGLLLTGSPSNVEPSRYGDAAAGEGPFDRGRDGMTATLIEAMTRRARPILGICRGMQELNVAFGGTLQRGLGDGGRSPSHHAPPDANLEAMFGHRHAVTLSPSGLLARASGRGRIEVNSVHYQGIDRLGDGLTVEAVADDGVIEAISARQHGAMILAVQWHPEWGDDVDGDVFAMFGLAVRGQQTFPMETKR